MPEIATISPWHVVGLFYAVFAAATALAEHRMSAVRRTTTDGGGSTRHRRRNDRPSLTDGSISPPEPPPLSDGHPSANPRDPMLAVAAFVIGVALLGLVFNGC